jgi:large subunit ribosomal protein L35
MGRRARAPEANRNPKGNTAMPKKKTNKAAKKRCHVTATGKVLATRAGKSHLLSSMSRKRKRNLRGTKTLGNKEQAKTIKSLLQS